MDGTDKRDRPRTPPDAPARPEPDPTDGTLAGGTSGTGFGSADRLGKGQKNPTGGPGPKD